MSFRKILAAIDHSPLSEVVFEQACDLATANQANLLLFHCLSADMLAGTSPLSGELGVLPRIINQAYQAQQVYLEQQIGEIQTLLTTYCQRATQRGILAEFGYQVVDAGQGLCQIAATWGADVLILGRRGRTGWTEVLLGSVSNYVLHHAPCAVLVIQPTTPRMALPTLAVHTNSINNTLLNPRS